MEKAEQFAFPSYCWGDYSSCILVNNTHSNVPFITSFISDTHLMLTIGSAPETASCVISPDKGSPWTASLAAYRPSLRDALSRIPSQY